MDALTITIAGPDDIDDLIGLRVRWTDGGEVTSPGFERRFREWWRDEANHRTFWIGRRGGRAVAMVNLVRAGRMPSVDNHDRGDWAYLGNMFVDPSEQNEGVGSRLLAAVLAHADSTGVARIMLRPTERSRPFYARAGFVPAADDVLIRVSAD